MKTAVIVDFDSRRILFQKIVGALRLLPSLEDWDLSWGEPFLAVTKDHRIWVRVFYEESLPLSRERLQHEIERLKPHLTEGGELNLCVPQSWGLGTADFPEGVMNSVRIWNYSSSEKGFLAVREIACEAISPPAPKVEPMGLAATSLPVEDRRLNAEEVRGLAEMGIALKRFCLKKAS